MPFGPRSNSHGHSTTGVRASACRRLVFELVSGAPGSTALLALLLLTTGITEGFGLLLLIPLLQLAGLGDAGREGSAVADIADRIATSFSVEVSLHGILALFLVLAVIRAIAAWGRGTLSSRLQLEFTDRLRGELYAAIAGADWQDLVGRRRSDVQYLLADSIGRSGSAAFLLLQLAVGSTLAAVQFAIALAISPAAALVASALGLALVVASRPLARRAHSLGREQAGSGRVLRGQVTDFLDGLKIVKSQNAGQRHLRRFRKQAARVRERQIAFASLSAGTQSLLQLVVAASLAGLVWYMMASAQLALPELALFVLVFARVMPNLLKLLRQTQTLVNLLPSYAEAGVAREELQSVSEPRGGTRPAPAVHAGIEVRGVGFEYPEGTARVLDEVSLDIPAGEVLAITGPSGSGKTTLVDLLLGLLRPTRGCILVGGTALENLDLADWRSRAAYVVQEPYLLHESIRSNLSWACPDAAEADMQEALQWAAADFVDALERGLDTLVGDRGGRLSGGERQRIALAAALLRKPALLVLDEPTGQLDARNEGRVIETLCGLRGQATVIVITHSPALLARADHTLVLDAGRIVSYGPRGHVIA